MTRTTAAALVVLLLPTATAAAFVAAPHWSSLGFSAARPAATFAVGPDDPLPAPPLWPYLVKTGAFTSPAIDAANRAYFGSDDGGLHAVESDGQGRMIYRAKAAIRSSPTILQ